MITDARDLPPGTGLTTAVCIIGSGPAGVSVATRLTAAGVDVLVLEAGGAAPDAAGVDAHRGTMDEGTAHDPLELTRERRLGGTSSQWGGRCSPLDPLDTTERSWVPGSGWPLGSEDLAPHYRAAAEVLELGRPAFTTAQAWGSDPLVRVDADREQDVDTSAVWRWSPPVRFAEVLDRLRRTGRVSVLSRAPVVRLEQDGSDERITGVVVSPSPGREIRITAEVVVLAAGAIESTRLLLASRGRRPTGIGNAHDLVGRHYTTHPVAEVGRLELLPAGRPLAAGFVRDDEGVYTMRALALSPRAQERHGLLNCRFAVWYPQPGDADHRDPLLSAYALVRAGLARTRADFKSSGVHARYAELPRPAAHVRNVVAGLPRLAAFSGTWARHRYLAPRRLPSMLSLTGSPLRLRFDAEQTPDRANRVVLGDEVDALGVPRVRVSYAVSAADRSAVHRGLEVLGDGLRAAGLAVLHLPDPEVLQQVPLTDGTHPMGLLRMGADERAGVVDADGRLFDARNLFVVSSAVFPTGGAVGPTMTVVALALRTADRIVRDLRARAHD